MPEFKEPVTGRFCWVELQTKDPAAAGKFYGQLFGWKLEDMPSPGGAYTTAKVGNNHSAGLMQLPEQAAKMGVPSHWASYVAVDDVAASVAKAGKLGAKTLVGPTAMGPGTFAVLQDPVGANFLLWHTTQSMGTFLFGEPGALTWNELVTANVDVAQRFYTSLFGWKAEPMKMPEMTYTVLKKGDEGIGGILPMDEELRKTGAPSQWVPYFSVSDPDAIAAKATKLGGKVMMPVTDVPEAGRLGWLQDPQGAVFAIIKTMPPA